MEETALKDLDSRLFKQIENARKALATNPAYAVDVMSSIVKRNPECLEARKILRQAQQHSCSGGTKNLKTIFLKLNRRLLGLGGLAKVKKDPLAAMNEAEKVLNADPQNLSAHKIVGASAEALELFETAAFAFEEMYKINSKDAEVAAKLMSIYIRLGKYEKAIRVGDHASKEHPAHNEIQSLIKKASVDQSIKKGNWEEEGSFHSKLKDEDESQKLEQASRAKTGDAELRLLIENAERKVGEAPENLNLYRELFNNYRKLKEFDKALEWIGKARQLEAGSADVNLDRIETTVKLEKLAQAIALKREALESDPQNEELKQAVKELCDQEQAYRFSNAKEMVQRYPNEYFFRYELGRIYYDMVDIDKAIKELQLAQRSPKVRVNALVLLGKAYMSKRFFDLAAEQFEIAKTEVSGMTEQKKEVLYELGICYEKQGDAEKAIAEYKALYSIDISYRDIAKKIDDFYAQG